MRTIWLSRPASAMACRMYLVSESILFHGGREKSTAIARLRGFFGGEPASGSSFPGEPFRGGGVRLGGAAALPTSRSSGPSEVLTGQRDDDGTVSTSISALSRGSSVKNVKRSVTLVSHLYHTCCKYLFDKRPHLGWTYVHFAQMGGVWIGISCQFSKHLSNQSEAGNEPASASSASSRSQ